MNNLYVRTLIAISFLLFPIFPSAFADVSLPTQDVPLTCAATDDWGFSSLVTIEAVDGGFKVPGLRASDVVMSVEKSSESLVVMSGASYSNVNNGYREELVLHRKGKGRVVGVLSTYFISDSATGGLHGSDNSINYVLSECK